ncbi:hypothetical protein EGT50_10035 [Rhodococcus xishaensis]|uniref:Uncharacterized protein n=1 Tax=Rhodococcus xishaensis TaxID=2487364 RepID=A0A438AWH6_9NOCA|nr:hypothetical protein EGT50_10035 [Rhodococcus xishaensis]
MAAVGVLATACGSGSTEDSANVAASLSTSPTSTTPAPTTAVSPEQALYSEYSSALTAAGIDFRPGSDGTMYWDKLTCEELRSGELDPYDFATRYGVYRPTDANEGRRSILMVPILCPDQQPIVDQAIAGDVRETTFRGGKRLIGNGLELSPLGGYYLSPGTYQTEKPVTDCYWERSDANGNIIDNNFVTLAPSVTVTIAPTDSGFTSKGCGIWKLVE